MTVLLRENGYIIYGRNPGDAAKSLKELPGCDASLDELRQEIIQANQARLLPPLQQKGVVIGFRTLTAAERKQRKEEAQRREKERSSQAAQQQLRQKRLKKERHRNGRRKNMVQFAR